MIAIKSQEGLITKGHRYAIDIAVSDDQCPFTVSYFLETEQSIILVCGCVIKEYFGKLPGTIH